MITAPFLTDPVLAKVWDALPDARVVGGAVRDALANRPIADIDLATPLTPQAVTAALHAAGVKVVPTGLTHGTVTAVANGRGFEVTTLRHDVKTDGRRAVVAFTTDWRQDAARRDFTINAMSISRNGTLFDYFGGEADLAIGCVRFVGDPARRIAEDYLRILRFFRFYARFGRVPPDQATLDALQRGTRGMLGLSAERVWNELRGILSTPNPTLAVALMDHLGIWSAVLPEATATSRLSGLPPDPILRLAAMLTGDPLALATRLKFSNEDRDRLLRLLATPTPKGSDTELRRLLADHTSADLIDRTWLSEAGLSEAALSEAALDGSGPDGSADVRRRLAGMRRPVFLLEGRDVLALGIPAGPAVGTLLRDVRQWWLDAGCIADRAACVAELARRADLLNMGTKR
jgi:poly(A) polymerase